ncbi:MAG: histidine kinase [Chitinophagaceae bacterium]|nr:histidine kinase [Chitinophagaceae bacterium]
MAPFLVPLIISLLLSQRLRKHAILNNKKRWELVFNINIYFSSFLFLVQFLAHDSPIFRWAWDVLIITIIVFSLSQKELRPLRMFFWAFIPVVIVMLASHLTELINENFYNEYANYFDNVKSLMLIWMAAILFSQNRQQKAQEKERIKRHQEDELNKAIAIRKVELEGLVAERTAELTGQKEELQRALTELRSTQTQLIHSEKMASLGELTAGIAHEIQNPLNFVNNFSEVSNELLNEMKTELESGHTNEAMLIANDVRQNLEKIIHHGKRADGIVKGMLQHSRASTGKKEPTDINALADEYLRLAYHGLRAKDKSFNASLKTDFDPDLGKINVIPQDIGRVILNLLTNAFYAVSEKKKMSAANSGYEPTVSVTTKKAGGKAVITISDNGNGIPQHAMERIFQPFFTTKPTGQGTGLGLSISYDIITKGHGGELKVETKVDDGNPDNSGKGTGTIFTIYLPVN